MKTRPEQFAFPGDLVHEYGLTKREYFAAMAMQGLVANSSPEEYVIIAETGGVVVNAVRIADKLIKELNND